MPTPRKNRSKDCQYHAVSSGKASSVSGPPAGEREPCFYEEIMSAAVPSTSELIAAYLDAVVRNDASAVDRYLDPKVEYMVNGTPEPDAAGALPPISSDCHRALPWLGLYRDREALKGFLAHMHRNLEVTAFGPRDLFRKETKRPRLAGSGFALYPQAGPPTFPTRFFLSCARA